MCRVTCQICLVLCFPFSLVGQQARITNIETTGNGYKREYFSYFDSLLSEIRTYNKDDEITKRVIFTYNESFELPVGVSIREGTQHQEWYIRYSKGRVAEISMVGIDTPQGYIFSYNKLGELKSIKLIGKVKGSWGYSFAKGNLSSIRFKMPRSFPLTAKNKRYTAYDSQVNYWRLITKSMWKHRAILAIFFGDDCWSLNNPLHYSMDHKEGERVRRYDYEYDESGNPVRIIIKATGEPDNILTLTYTSVPAPELLKLIPRSY